MSVSSPEAINYIHVIFNLYNQLNKFVAFRNVTKLSMNGRVRTNEMQFVAPYHRYIHTLSNHSDKRGG